MCSHQALLLSLLIQGLSWTLLGQELKLHFDPSVGLMLFKCPFGSS